MSVNAEVAAPGSSQAGSKGPGVRGKDGTQALSRVGQNNATTKPAAMTNASDDEILGIAGAAIDGRRAGDGAFDWDEESRPETQTNSNAEPAKDQPADIGIEGILQANPELRQAWDDARAYRESFRTPEEGVKRVSRSRPALIQVTRETHDAPVGVQERVEQAGGLNWLGEPNFRVVWGESRLAWVGGKWTDRDIHGCVIRECTELRRIPKYLPTNRWHVERWMPPEAYGSPENWWKQTVEAESGIRIPALGPYPSRGEYEHCFTVQGAKGEFIPLSAAACDWIVRAVEWARRQPRTVKRKALEHREMRNESDWNQAADALLELPAGT